MKQRELLIRTGIGAFSFLIAYLFASFVKLSFDISKWGEDVRLIVALLGGCFSLLVATFPNYNFKDE